MNFLHLQKYLAKFPGKQVNDDSLRVFIELLQTLHTYVGHLVQIWMKIVLDGSIFLARSSQKHPIPVL
jgi:hypothetical protein